MPVITLAMITDGLSNTIFASERALGSINANRVKPWGQWTYSLYTSLYASNPPNSVFRDWSRPAYKTTLLPMMLVSSQHPGGANILMGDGSAGFVKETVGSWPLDATNLGPVGIISWIDGFKDVPPPGIWQSLVTRAGGEIIGARLLRGRARQTAEVPDARENPVFGCLTPDVLAGGSAGPERPWQRDCV